MKFKSLTFLFALITFASGAQDNYPMFSVFFYNFTKYIQWPDEASQGDFEVTVIGNTPMTTELKKLSEKKKVNGRAIKIMEINSVAEIRKCQIVFLASSSSALLPELLKKTKGMPVLVVTEAEGLTKKGSGINFVERDGKAAFELNLETINDRKLKVFSELTKWAILAQ